MSSWGSTGHSPGEGAGSSKDALISKLTDVFLSGRYRENTLSGAYGNRDQSSCFGGKFDSCFSVEASVANKQTNEKRGVWQRR